MGLRDRADDRQAEPAAAPADGVGGALATDEAIEDLLLDPGGDARAVVEDLEQRLVAVAPRGQLDGGLLGRVPDGVLEQVADQAVELVRVAVAAAAGPPAGSPAGARPRAAGPPRGRPPRSAPGRGRCGRPGGPASARASSRRSETRPDIRLVEESAESTACRSSSEPVVLRPAAARGSPGCWSAGSAARGRRRRRTRAGARATARAPSGPRRAPGACRPSSGPARRPRRRWPGAGIRFDGSRVLVIWRASPVSALIGRIARSATARPASRASSVPPSTPAPRKSQSRATVSLTPSSGAARTGRSREAAGVRGSVIGSVATLSPPTLRMPVLRRPRVDAAGSSQRAACPY